MNFKIITSSELKEKLDRRDDFRLIDVREPVEFEIARIEGAGLKPLSRFQEWAETINAAGEIVFMCHHGIRSANVFQFFAHNDFEYIYNLTGGIDAWSAEIDENVPRY